MADSFFNCIAGNDPSLVNRIWEMIGYILVPDARAKVFFLLQGLPNSGKSVLGRFIEGFFSPGRVTSLDISQLGAKYFPEAMFDSFLNLSMDLPNKKLPLGAVARIKMMTGDDLTTYEPKFKEARPYRGLGKLLFATNHTLKLHEWDQAFVNRIVCIPFNHSIPAEAQDRNLLSKLEYERANIAMKAISQYINLRLNNYQFSGNFRPLIDCQPSDNEIICEFVNKKCRLVPHDEGKTHSSVLFKAYINFCKENGYTPLTAMDGFSQRLQNNFNGKIFSSRWRENGQNANGYMGIILRNPQYLEGPVVARFQI